jgi:hypothetical protein
MPHRAPTRLMNPRVVAKHKHDTLPWVIVAEHGRNATSSSDFPWQDAHETATNCPEANARDRSKLPSSSTLRRAAPTSKHKPTPRPQLLQPPSRVLVFDGRGSCHVSLLLSHVPDTTAPISHCKTLLHATSRRREAKHNRRRRIRSHDENSNTTPSGRERPRWRHRPRVFLPLDERAKGGIRCPQ